MSAVRRIPRAASAYALQRLARPRADGVVYSSFTGRFSDNPRAIFEELERRRPKGHHTWIADGPRDAFAGSVRTVAPFSPAFLRAIGRSRYLVANVQMANNLLPRRDLSYLQTWHGTPLKRIGLDNARWKAKPAARDTMLRDVAKWDYLVSQNPFSTEIFRRAFGFEGTVLETGYPRNDALRAPDAQAQRLRIRERLGIAEGQTAVLYAPTWRDDEVSDDQTLQFSAAGHVRDIADRLGDEHVLLLRLHYLLAGALGDVGPRVRNVSGHPDIRDLYLAADVLITDYSSAMFDFAVTGKPLVFFTYDLDRYRDDVRGVYFDLEAEAPGAVCRTADEVLQALGSIERDVAVHADRYERFRARFCPWDDGRAAARIVDRVFRDPWR